MNNKTGASNTSGLCAKMQLQRSNKWIALAILILLAAIYSIPYSGTFVTDDEHILSSQAISIAFDSHPDFSRVIGNSRVYQFSVYSKTSADQALNIEPAQALIGALLAKFSVLIHTGRIQTLFLLNIWVTALTAAILFLTVVLRGYSPRGAVIIAFLFGLGTMAFPYSRTYFRDPLAMLFLTCAIYFSSGICRHTDESQKTGWKLWCGFILSSAAGVLAKNTILIAIPILLIEIWIARFSFIRDRIMNKRRDKRLWFVIFLAMILLVSIWFLVIPKIPLLARFTPSYYGFLLKYFFTTPRPNFLQAILGPLVSPGKSIFLFSPILVLSIWCLFKDFRNSWSAWLYLIVLIIAQALFYDSEWAGHINWGPRYLLPATPLLLLSIAPVIDKGLDRFQKISGLLCISLVSLFVQLLGVLPPIRQYFIQISEVQPVISTTSMIWDYKQSIILWSIRWIFSGKPLDIALQRVSGEMSILILILILVVIVMTGISIVFTSNRKLLIVFLMMVTGVNIALLFVYKGDSAYYPSRGDFIETQKEISEQFTQGDYVFIKSYGTPVWNYWINWTDPEITWSALPYIYPTPELIKTYSQNQEPDQVLDEISLGILRKDTVSGRRIWLVLPGDSPGSDLGIEEKWLEERSTITSCRDYTDKNDTTKLCEFVIK
jgi:hypothetical protein